jgi:hypothetical protein
MYGNKHRLETGSNEPNTHVTDFAILFIGIGNTKSPAAIKSGAQLWDVQQLVSKILMGSPSDLVHSYFKAMMVRLVSLPGLGTSLRRDWGTYLYWGVAG